MIDETVHGGDEIGELADLFHLLGDPTRLAIVFACLDGPRGVSEIARRVGASDSLVSHHLRLLRAGRILRRERRGRQVLYAPLDAHITTILLDMSEHVREPRRRPEAGR